MQVERLTILCLIAVSVVAHPFVRPEDDPLKIAELNEFVDNVLTVVRKSPVMIMMDPLQFPDQHRAVEHGSYRLLTATATGLSTLTRLGDVTYIRSDDRPEDVTLTIALATDSVRVVSNVMAQTNSEKISFGKIVGTLEPVQVVLQMRVQKGSPRPTMTSYTVNSHLHPLAERYSGKTEDDELFSIVKDAIDYGFNFVYGVNLEKVVEGALRQEIVLALDTINFPAIFTD